MTVCNSVDTAIYEALNYFLVIFFVSNYFIEHLQYPSVTILKILFNYTKFPGLLVLFALVISIISNNVSRNGNDNSRVGSL